MEAQAALHIFTVYSMIVIPIILLLLVPLVVSELQAMRPQVVYALSGFVVVGRKSRVGILYGVQFEQIFSA